MKKQIRWCCESYKKGKGHTCMMPKHTPTPWKVADEVRIICADATVSGHVASVGFGHEVRPVEKADAAFIVRAVNNHEELLRKVKLFADTERERIETIEGLEVGYGEVESEEDKQDMIGHHTQLLNELLALIAKAEGK